MDAVLKWLAFSMQILPVILQGVVLAEQTVGAGNGAAKKALVSAAADPAITGVISDASSQAIARSLVSAQIDAAVAAQNAAGKFQTAAK